MSSVKGFILAAAIASSAIAVPANLEKRSPFVYGSIKFVPELDSQYARDLGVSSVIKPIFLDINPGQKTYYGISISNTTQKDIGIVQGGGGVVGDDERHLGIVRFDGSSRGIVVPTSATLPNATPQISPDEPSVFESAIWTYDQSTKELFADWVHENGTTSRLGFAYAVFIDEALLDSGARPGQVDLVAIFEPENPPQYVPGRLEFWTFQELREEQRRIDEQSWISQAYNWLAGTWQTLQG